MVCRSIIATLAGCTLLGGSAVPAAADATAPQSVAATVNVGSALTLTGLPSSFMIAGFPGDDSFSELVNYTVATNSASGYVVTVQAESPTLNGVTAGNHDSIPIDLLQVSNSGGGWGYTVSDTSATVVGESTTRSQLAGDNLFTQFRMIIPDVTNDRYTVAVDFVASTPG